MKKIIIIGAGGHACSVANIAFALNYKIVAFVDDKSQNKVF